MSASDAGNVASGATVATSMAGLWLNEANLWAGEYMPLITAFGILSGALLTWWFYRARIKLLKREMRYKENGRH